MKGDGMLNAAWLKEKALEWGAAAVGIGDIARFDGAPPQRDPRRILPDATCVIGCAIRVPRMLYRVMADREQYMNYTQLGVKFIDEDLAEILLLKLGGLIEDAGYDACLQRNISNLPKRSPRASRRRRSSSTSTMRRRPAGWARRA